jgi:hypothetical protein
VKDNFYKELECMFDKFPKYHIKNLLRNFSAKVGKPTIGNVIYLDVSRWENPQSD